MEDKKNCQEDTKNTFQVWLQQKKKHNPHGPMPLFSKKNSHISLADGARILEPKVLKKKKRKENVTNC